MLTWLRTRDGGCLPMRGNITQNSRGAGSRPLRGRQRERASSSSWCRGHDQAQKGGLKSPATGATAWGWAPRAHSIASFRRTTLPSPAVLTPILGSPALLCFTPEWPEFRGDLSLLPATALPRGGHCGHSEDKQHDLNALVLPWTLSRPQPTQAAEGLSQGSGLGMAWGEALCVSEPRFPHLSKHPHALAHVCIP